MAFGAARTSQCPARGQHLHLKRHAAIRKIEACTSLPESKTLTVELRNSGLMDMEATVP